MTKHIGIAACSAEGAALCYRTICLESFAILGPHNHPEITMNSIPMARSMPHFESGELQPIADILLESSIKLANCGADFVICPDNTCHMAFELVAKDSPLPWLHIAEVVAAEAIERNFQRVTVLGTKYLMESSVYPKAFVGHKLTGQIPEIDDRKEINRIIFNELVNGIFLEESRLYFNDVIERQKQGGCDAVVLGCTEIPLLVRPDDCPLPSLDSTRLLAKAAIVRALQ